MCLGWRPLLLGRNGIAVGCEASKSCGLVGNPERKLCPTRLGRVNLAILQFEQSRSIEGDFQGAIEPSKTRLLPRFSIRRASPGLQPVAPNSTGLLQRRRVRLATTLRSMWKTDVENDTDVLGGIDQIAKQLLFVTSTIHVFGISGRFEDVNIS